MNSLNILLICVFFLSGLTESIPRRKVLYCSLQTFAICYAETFSRFTSQLNGTGIVTTDEEYEEYCQ